MKVKVSNIIWDFTSDDIPVVSTDEQKFFTTYYKLPTNVEIVVPEDVEDIFDYVTNELSDRYGFCIDSLQVITW